MSFQEKKILLNTVSSVLITAAYFAYLFVSRPLAELADPSAFSHWAGIILLFIGVSVAARILISIVFVIIVSLTSKEKVEDRADERDKLFELKGHRNGYFAFSAAFLAGMVALALGLPGFTIFLFLAFGGLFSELVSDLTQLYFYRRGY